MPNPMDVKNLKTFESKDIVSRFSKRDQLYKSEQIILNLLKPDLDHMKMLDIGVGGGRTTGYFANLVKEYMGIDYSSRLIDACQKRFSKFAKARFARCDVRSMDIFADNYFDFVLFSFNGIDCIAHEDRINALKEIHRVAKQGAYFCFSSHNILAVDDYFKFHFSRLPLRLTKNIIKFIYIRLVNPHYKELVHHDYTIINDGSYNFRLLIYYIKPACQIEQLHNYGFEDIRIFSDNGEEEYKNIKELKQLWLYYLCRVRK